MKTGFPAVRVLDSDMQMLSAEILLDLQVLPALRDGRGDPDSFRIRTQTQDPFHTSDHDRGSGAGQPMDMGAARMFAGAAFRKLAVAVGLQAADLRPVILGGRGIFHKVGEGAFPMPPEGFRQDQPSLGLGKDACVFLGPLVVDDGKRAVKCVRMVRRIHQEGAVVCV